MSLSAVVTPLDMRAVDFANMAEDGKSGETKVRGVRLEQDLWDKLGPAAAGVGMDRSRLIRQLCRWYVREPGAKLPPRPGE